jgi:Arc/MetJ-type ribon-helix-helix transcriptional regulator
MSSFTIEISESVKAYIDDEIASGRFANPSDLIHKLVLDERKRTARTHVERLALEALESELIPWNRESMQRLREEFQQRRKRSEAM